MQRALRLAEEAKGWTSPNPMVGAILVKDDERIGEGYHHQFGDPHAEIEALKNCASNKKSPKGATLYVTLEPCCHHGKTPPCTQAIIDSGITKVVVAVRDPSEKVNGKGIGQLRDAGIEVEVGLLEGDARELNKHFFTYHEKNRPFVTLKAALSLDGKISQTGEETTLTGMPAQRYVHVLRHEHQAILVGAGTVLTDNPHLGVRHVEGRDPLRVILAGKRRLPKTLAIFRDENVLVLKDLSVQDVLKTLYEKEITSVLVEGGHDIFESFMEAQTVDELQLFIAPIFLGNKAVPFAELKKPISLKNIHHKILGKDLLLHAIPEFPTKKKLKK